MTGIRPKRYPGQGARAELWRRRQDERHARWAAGAVVFGVLAAVSLMVVVAGWSR